MKTILNQINANKGYIISVVIIIITIIGFIAFNNYKNVQNAKLQMLQEENKKLQLDEEQKMLLENKKILEEERKIKEAAEEEKELLIQIIEEAELKEECTQIQIQRIFEGLPVEKGYCNKNVTIKEPVEEKIEEVIEVAAEKPIKSIEPRKWTIKKDFYFSCIENGAKDPARCAAYAQLVYHNESNIAGIAGQSRRCVEDNNCFGIKTPTDKGGLVGKWKEGTGRHVIFETKEMGLYAFTYYYAKYHEHRNATQFVNRWAGWHNGTYISDILVNYDTLYNEYSNFLSYTN